MSTTPEAKRRSNGIKIYVVLPDLRAEADGLIRVIDEDGEDYLYPNDWFEPVEVSKVIETSLLRAS